jgi:hypothetical protein
MTVVADFPSRDLELRLFPIDGFFKRQFKIVLQIGPAFGTLGSAGALTEEIIEDVVENISEPAPWVEAFTTEALRPPGVAECVVPPALVLIAQDFIGFVDLFEIFFGDFLLLISGVHIGVVLAGQHAKRHLDLFH